MSTVVVFDSGYGGEFFADLLEEELSVVNIIRVIDWRHANQLQSDIKAARKIAQNALAPYIGKVDLIIFANYFLAITSLKYFRHQYQNQRFVGLKLPDPSPGYSNSLILTTKSVAKTVSYYNYLFRFRHKVRTLTLDSWPSKIDDGELTESDIKTAFLKYIRNDNLPQEIFLICSQFYDLKPELRKLFGRNLKIHDGFYETLREVCKILRLRGSLKKLK